MDHRKTIAATGLFALAASAHAQPISITCTEELLGQEAVAGKTATHSIAITEGDPGSATIDGRFGSHKLAARFIRDPSIPAMFGVRLSGAARSPMPDKGEIDACVNAARAKHPALYGDGDMDDVLARDCRRKATFKEALIRIEIQMTIAQDGVSDLLVERSYAGDDERGKTLYGIASFTEWKCAIAK